MEQLASYIRVSQDLSDGGCRSEVRDEGESIPPVPYRWGKRLKALVATLVSLSVAITIGLRVQTSTIIRSAVSHGNATRSILLTDSSCGGCACNVDCSKANCCVAGFKCVSNGYYWHVCVHDANAAPPAPASWTPPPSTPTPTYKGPPPTPVPNPTPSPAVTQHPVVRTAVHSGATCRFYIGQNNYGSNLHSSAPKTSTYGQCCDLCLDSKSCVGYTWVVKSEECWLKSGVGTLGYDDAVVSGSFEMTPGPTIRPTPAPSPRPTPAPTPMLTPMPTPMPTPAPTGPKKATCTSHVGQNNQGTNLHSDSIVTESFTECCYQCWITADCVGYTWIKSSGKCWMKATVEDMTPDHLVVSGSPDVSPPSTSILRVTRLTTSPTTPPEETSTAATTKAITLRITTPLAVATVAPASTTTGAANLTDLIMKARDAILEKKDS